MNEKKTKQTDLRKKSFTLQRLTKKECKAVIAGGTPGGERCTWKQR